MSLLRTRAEYNDYDKKMASLAPIGLKASLSTDGEILKLKDRVPMLARLIDIAASIGKRACLKMVMSKDGHPYMMFQSAADPNRNHSGQLVYAHNKQLGAGTYGIAYIGRADTFKRCALKISEGGEENMFESRLGKFFTKGVMQGKCPNFACTVGYFQCNNPNLGKLYIPRDLRYKINRGQGYMLTIMELANGSTIRNLFDSEVEKTGRIGDTTFLSFILQALFAVRTVHSTGTVHSDTHLGNFFFNRVEWGTPWHYQLHSTSFEKGFANFVVPNEGFQVLLADFGMCEKYTTEPKLFGDQWYGGARQDFYFIFRELQEDMLDETYPNIRGPKMSSNALSTVSRMVSWIEKYVRADYDVNPTYFADECIKQFARLTRELFNIDLAAWPYSVVNKVPYKCELPNIW